VADDVLGDRDLHDHQAERVGEHVLSVGLLIAGFAIQVKPSDTAGNSVVNLAFMIGVFPGLIIGVFGSLVLGIMLLRADFAPRGSAVVIMLALPVWFVGSVVLGHNGLGIAPQLLAWSFAVAAVVERSDSRVSATIA